MTHVSTFKNICKVWYEEELARKFIDKSDAEFYNETATVYWSILVANHGDHCRLSIYVDAIEASMYWVTRGELDETKYAPIEEEGEIKICSKEDWKIHNMCAPEINDDESIFKINFKPLIVQIDFKAKDLVVEEWGESLNNRNDRVLTTIDPSVRYERNQDETSC